MLKYPRSRNKNTSFFPQAAAPSEDSINNTDLPGQLIDLKVQLMEQQRQIKETEQRIATLNE